MKLEENRSEIIAKLQGPIVQVARFAFLFGSAATDTLGPESDVDLGVYVRQEPVSFDEKLRLNGLFQNAVNRELDVIFMNDADPIIVEQILANGIEIFCDDPGFLLGYRARKMSEYLDFKKSREPVEKTLMKKGWPLWKKKTSS